MRFINAYDSVYFCHSGFHSREELGKLFSMVNMSKNPKFVKLPVPAQNALKSAQDRLAFALMLQAHRLGHLEDRYKA